MKFEWEEMVKSLGDSVVIVCPSCEIRVPLNIIEKFIKIIRS